MVIWKILFCLSGFLIVWAMIGYKWSLRILNKIFTNRKLKKDYSQRPAVSVLVVAHNEEKVIADKLKNLVQTEYPLNLIQYIVASDYSTDRTNELVEGFIKKHPELNIILYKAKDHKGKTNAQNEAQKLATGEILIMTDANAMFAPNAISELVASFSDDRIVYVTGQLVYQNSNTNDTAAAESLYWEGDLEQRRIESNIQTITAGNGAIYACRNGEYYDFLPIECHDSCMPYYFARIGKRAIYNPDACAYEKAGEVNEDEFKRKVRMNRTILKDIAAGFQVLNPMRYHWFAYFYFGHRTSRYLLWLSHGILLLTSCILATRHWIYSLALVFQILFFAVAFCNYKMKITYKPINMITYYSMTILAQWKGVYNCLTGKARPTWEKAESTR